MEIADGVHVLTVGPRPVSSNVVFISSESTWSLVDTGWSSSSDQIATAAISLFGADNPPASILLTHIHPDHAGSALTLAQRWNRPVHIHPEEVRFAPGVYIPEYANPLDRWVVAPLLKLTPERLLASMQAKSSITDVIAVLDPDGGVPGRPELRTIHSPGHTPGQVAFFRPSDRVLIAGDAARTVNVNNLRDLISGRTRVSPPRIATWDWELAMNSLSLLASVEPGVLVGGHGAPMATAVNKGFRALLD